MAKVDPLHISSSRSFSYGTISETVSQPTLWYIFPRLQIQSNVFGMIYCRTDTCEMETHKSIGDKFIQMAERLVTRIVYVDIALQSKSTSLASASATSPVDGGGSIIALRLHVISKNGDQNNVSIDFQNYFLVRWWYLLRLSQIIWCQVLCHQDMVVAMLTYLKLNGNIAYLATYKLRMIYLSKLLLCRN